MTDALPPIRELGRRFREGALSPLELARSILARIAAHDNELACFHRVTGDIALAAARKAEADFAAGVDRGPLQGIPYAAVDVVDIAGQPTLCGSRLRLGHRAERDAWAVERLSAAGAVLIGKTATFEFAIGSPGPDSLFPPARNPWDRRHSPGASAAGATIAAGFVPLAIGTDTGGAVRGSAALCGVVGLKPTFGLVSRRGIAPLSDSLDHCGLLAVDSESVALGLEALVAFDAGLSSETLQPQRNFTAVLERGIEGMTLGAITDIPGVDEAAACAIEAAAATLEAQGAVVRTVRLDFYRQLLAVGQTIYAAECYAIHRNDLMERPQLYGRSTRDRLTAGAAVRSEHYAAALQTRRVLTARLDDELLGPCDALLAPSAPGPAPALDLDRHESGGRAGTMTLPFNVTGHPALSVRCGTSDSGLPLGLQIVGRAFAEADVLRIARAYEQVAAHKHDAPEPFGVA